MKKYYLEILEKLEEHYLDGRVLFICNIIESKYKCEEGNIDLYYKVLNHFKKTLPKVVSKSDIKAMNKWITTKEELKEALEDSSNSIWSGLNYTSRVEVLKKIINYLDLQK